MRRACIQQSLTTEAVAKSKGSGRKKNEMTFAVDDNHVASKGQNEKSDNPARADSGFIPPTTMVMAYWRSQLNPILRRDVFLRRIRVFGGRLKFETQTWDEYWDKAFRTTPVIIEVE